MRGDIPDYDMFWLKDA